MGVHIRGFSGFDVHDALSMKLGQLEMQNGASVIFNTGCAQPLFPRPPAMKCYIRLDHNASGAAY
jgi:hypothetical protein